MIEQYIQEVLNGNVNAFRYIVANYKDSAYSTSMSIVKSELVAQEAIQDAFVKAFENLSKFKGNSKFSTWFYRIVVNESLRKIKQKRLKTVDINDDNYNNTELVEDNGFKALHEVEQKEIINDILNKMSQTESLLLRLYYLEENKIDEISDITGLKTSNIKVILHRSRRRFYSILHETFKNEIRAII